MTGNVATCVGPVWLFARSVSRRDGVVCEDIPSVREFDMALAKGMRLLKKKQKTDILSISLKFHKMYVTLELERADMSEFQTGRLY